MYRTYEKSCLSGYHELAQNYRPNKVKMVTLFSINNIPNIAKQAIITNPTLVMCHVKPILIPWVVYK